MVSEVGRAFADPAVNAFALGPYSLPTLFSGTMGISLIDPLFRGSWRGVAYSIPKRSSRPSSARQPRRTRTDRSRCTLLSR